MKKLLVALLATALILAPVTLGAVKKEVGIQLHNTFARPYSDVNKLWDGKDNALCWLASICNQLAFIYNLDGQELYEHLRDYVPDKGANVVDAYWWVAKALDDSGILENVTIATFQTHDIIEWICAALHQYEIIKATVVHPWGFAHALTIYGYDVDDNGNIFFWYTDSDDTHPGWEEVDPDGYYPDGRMIRKVGVTMRRNMYGQIFPVLTGRYADWYLYSVASLPITAPTDLEYIWKTWNIPITLWEWTEEEQ